MKFAVYDGNSKVKDLKVSGIWDDASEKVMHQVVVARLANNRQGTASAKTRAEITATGKKPWRQKGLGHARAGTFKSPLWRGGGVTFGPKPKSFRQKINKKQKAVAYLYALKKMNELGNLKVVSSFEVASHRTKDFISALGNVVEDVKIRTAIVVSEYERNMILSSRNLTNIDLMCLDNLDILPLIYAGQIVITEDALSKLDEKLKVILNK